MSLKRLSDRERERETSEIGAMRISLHFPSLWPIPSWLHPPLWQQLSFVFAVIFSLHYVSSCKYLGFHIISSTEFSVSVNEDLRGFFGSVNSILTSVRQPRENVMMQLLYSNCVPKLTYGAAVKDLNASEKHQYNVAVNNAIRRIFGFRLWQSIRQIREFYGYPSIEIKNCPTAVTVSSDFSQRLIPAP